jgi:hypothetical protein
MFWAAIIGVLLNVFLAFIFRPLDPSVSDTFFVTGAIFGLAAMLYILSTPDEEDI